jgi:WD40 repeat protein
MDFGIAKSLAERTVRTIAGTPAYMALEQARGEAVDARADVFSAGVVMAEMIAPEGIRDGEARQMLWRAVHHEPPELPDTPWAAVLRKAVARDREERYATASALARALEEVALRVEGAEDVRPYPGLAAFTEEDAEYFFGRELEVEAMWKKLRRPHLLALIGPSGAGKSSFLRAGLIPTMPEGWRALIAAPGSRPFMALAQPLVGEFAGDTEATSGLLRFEEPDIAVSLMTRWRQGQKHALVIIDQFEELFTQNPPEVQERFADLLRRLALEADIHVLLSMRDDFLFQCQQYEGLSPIFSELTPLGVLGGSSLRRALVQPALKCGYRFEDDALVDGMVAEVEEERGALPLMAFAAARLWEKRDRDEGLLTREAYEEIGGVAGSLAQHAEATLERIGSDRIPIVRELFRNLVTAEGTRAARDRDELLSVFEWEVSADTETGVGGDLDAAAQVLNTLIDARLLTSYDVPPTEDEDTGHQRIEIIHESLLSAWPRLVRWQTQDTDSAQLRDQLRQAAQLWQERQRSDDLLWTGTAFREFQLWRERYPGGLSTTEEAFGQAMSGHAERRRRRKRFAVAAVVVAALGVAAVTGTLWRSSVAETRRAEAANLLSIGQLQVEDHPTAALAYAIASLELDDSPGARHLAVDALWRGPTEFRIPTGGQRGVDFTPDGRWLLTSSGGGQLWPSDGGFPTALEGSDVTSEVGMSPRGDLVAHAIDEDLQEMGLWSVPDGRFLRSFALGGPTYFLQFSRDGNRLITTTETFEGATENVQIRSWPVDGGEPDLLARLEIPMEYSGTFFGVDPTESWVAWAEGRRFNLAPLDGPSVDPLPEISLEHDRGVAGAAFDDQGRILATADMGGTMRLWSLEGDSPELIRTFKGLGGRVALRFDSSSSMLAGTYGFLWRLDAAPDAEPLRLRRVAGAIEGDTNEIGFGFAFEPNSRWLAIGLIHSVSLWPLARSYPQVLTGVEDAVNNLAFTPDGRHLVSTSYDGSVQLWPLGSSAGERSRILFQAEGALAFPTSLTMAPDGSFVILGNPIGQVTVLPLDGGPTRQQGGFQDAIGHFALSPDGDLVAWAGRTKEGDRLIRMWDLDTDEVRLLDTVDSERINGLEFTSDGDLQVYSGHTLRRWDLDEVPPRVLTEIELSGPVTTTRKRIDFSPDGRQALFSLKGRLWIHDLDDQTSRELSSYGNAAGGRFDPTGRFVVSNDKKGDVRIGLAEGGEPYLLLGHEGEVNAVAVSPDGKWIASGADDSTIRLWPMPDLEKPPLQTVPYDELLAKLRSLTNLRVVEDSGSSTGWKLELGPFPGWEEVPTW